MRTSRRSLLAALLAVLAVSCGSSGDAAATVDGDEITRDELEATMAADPASSADPAAPEGMPGVAEDDPEATAALQRQVLTILIQDEILRSVADDLGIEVDDESLAAARERVLAQLGGEEAVDQALAVSGLSQEAFEEVIVPQEALVQGMRLELAGEETIDTRSVRHILVETEEEAEEVIAELEAGADFAALAQERSIDPGSAPQGGELGTQPEGQFVPAFDEAVWGAELDTVVGPIETEFGFHVLEVTDEAALVPAEMDPQQLNQLVGAELGGLFASEFEESEISVDSGIGEWDPQSRSVVPGELVGDAEPEAPAIPGVESEADPQADPDTAPEPEAEPETDTEADPEADAGAETDATEPEPAS